MGDVTSGGVQDDAAANADIGGGGGDTSPSTPASLGFGGARGDIVARQTTSAPNVQPSRIAFNNQPISGRGPVNTFSRYLQTFTEPVTDFFTGGAQTDDRGPSDSDVSAVSVNDNQFNQGLASLSGVPDFVTMGGGTSPSDDRDTDTTMAALRRAVPTLRASNAPDFVTMGGGTSPIDARQRPDPNEMSMFERTTATQDFPPIVGPIRTVPAGGGDPLLFQDSRIMGMSPGAMGGSTIGPVQGPLPMDIDPTSDPAALDVFPLERRADLFPQELGGGTIDAPKLAALARSGGAKTQEELNILQRLGRFLKGVGKSISNFEMNDIFEFLKGDPNYKGPSAAQQQLMGVPGPGPFVGGGVPSPSGGGGMAAPAKDPCPPGFRFDPTLQQCVPIIAPNTPTDTTTPTATPTTPAPGTSPPAAGGIANAYPFTLTPPIGAPVGNLPPVRLTT